MMIRRAVAPVLAIAVGAGAIAGLAYAAQQAGSKRPAEQVALDNAAGSGTPTVIPQSPSPATPSESSTKPPTGPADTAPPAKNGRGAFSGSLTGAKEVPGDKPINDRDGNGAALIEIAGDEITFGLSWKRIGTPQAAHIHRAPAGRNGEVVADLFASPLPDSAWSATGKVRAPGVADRIRANPGNYYVNIHTKEFPGGAIRGQLIVAETVDPQTVLGTKKLVSQADGDQEVPGPGDPDGRATVDIWPWGACLDYAMRWSGITPPAMAHIHKGTTGVDGSVVGALFEQKLPVTLTGIAGRAEGQDRAVVQRIKTQPQNYYSNIHTQDFPKGAVRGQLGRR